MVHVADAIRELGQQAFGLSFGQPSATEVLAEVDRLRQLRDEARKHRKFDEGDRIRMQIESLGFVIEDALKGSLIRRKR